jgi:hypothetical protein
MVRPLNIVSRHHWGGGNLTAALYLCCHLPLAGAHLLANNFIIDNDFHPCLGLPYFGLPHFGLSQFGQAKSRNFNSTPTQRPTIPYHGAGRAAG